MAQATYREEVLKVEPKGVEIIQAAERHGSPGSLVTLWWAANVEFATLTTGAVVVAVFGAGFWQAAVAILLGTVLGALALAALSTLGPRWGLPQLIQSRRAFGYFGNFAPGILNLIAGMMWFAVNSVLGVYALQWLFRIGFLPALVLMVAVQVIVAVLGHNMIHAVERPLAYLLTAIFAIVTVYAIGHIHWGVGYNPHAPAASGWSGTFILTVGVAVSYIMGWTAFASDYTRYLPEGTSPRRIFRNVLGANVISCLWLELLGAALVTARPAGIYVPTDLVTGLLPSWIGTLAMIGVVVGTVTANVLNIYSGALSALVVGIPLRRWTVALVVGVVGAVLAYAGGRSSYYNNYANFLFVLAYWVAPWAAVVLVDLWRERAGGVLDAFYDRRHGVGPGLWAWLAGLACAWPFFNQSLYQGPVAHLDPGIGDLSYYVSFAVAGAVYLVLTRQRASTGRPVTTPRVPGPETSGP